VIEITTVWDEVLDSQPNNGVAHPAPDPGADLCWPHFLLWLWHDGSLSALLPETRDNLRIVLHSLWLLSSVSRDQLSSLTVGETRNRPQYRLQPIRGATYGSRPNAMEKPDQKAAGKNSIVIQTKTGGRSRR